MLQSPIPFYQQTITQTCDDLASSPHGLNDQQIRERQKLYGFNTLVYQSLEPRYYKIFKQLKDPMIVLLVIAALIAGYLGDIQGVIVLVLIIVINTIIGYVQETKAENIMQSLKTMLFTSAKVQRNGKLLEVDSTTLVPGDIVVIEEGDNVPADLRLIETTRIQTNDYSLTGESNPVRKHTQKIDNTVPLGDRNNMAFMGTTVASGSAKGIVVATGMYTQLGTIAHLAHTEKNSEPTPLQKEMTNIASKLTVGTLVIAVVLVLIALAADFTLGKALIFGIGIAAAMVPQGLPAQITVALSLAATRLAKKNALVKELNSVETLGAINVICTDKTGTLTQNEMTVSHVFVPGKQTIQVEGTGYEAKGSIQAEDLQTSQQWQWFLRTCVLASNARINEPDAEHPHRYPIGDPTEAALVVLGQKAGYIPEEMAKEYPEVFEFSFDSVRKRMSSVRKIQNDWYILVKGAPGAIVEKSTMVQYDQEQSSMTPATAQDISTYVDAMASQAMRNIACAYKKLSPELVKPLEELIHMQKEHDEEAIMAQVDAIHESIGAYESNLVFVGIASIIDPPRDNAHLAIKAAHDAHIKVVMITGDYALTAKAIAQKIGLCDQEGQYKIIHNEYLQRKTDIKLAQDLKHDNVIFARTSPEDKLRIVQLLKKSGHVVAVTGDGINDAPALKNANIGVAMGKIGTDVAKDASKIVLMDDSFATLVDSIKEGRTIYKNLTKTIVASMTTNGGELGIVLFSLAIASLTGIPIAITAVQILAIDLIGEMLPLIALTFDLSHKGIMQEPPRKLGNHILDKKTIISLIVTGLFLGALAYGAYILYGRVHGIPMYELATDSLAYRTATTVTYTSIILGQFGNILSVRAGRTHSLFSGYMFTNRRLLASFAISLVLVAIVMYVPFVSQYFGFGPLALIDWGIAIAVALIYVTGRECWKYVFFAQERRNRILAIQGVVE